MMHSLETLEFLLDASRYRCVYHQTFLAPNSIPIEPAHPDNKRITIMWSRLIDAYVRPGGSREVNLPGELRDALLLAPTHSIPPPPELLDASSSHIYNLMRDGVLSSFIASCDANNPPYHVSTKSDSSFTRNLWTKSSGGLLNRNNSSSSNNSTRSSSAELASPISSTSQPISIPYPMSSPHRSSFPPSKPARSVGYLSQPIATNHEESSLDSWLENTSDEMSDIDEGSLGQNSSSGRASPMTPPLTPPPHGEGSPIREGGMWSRRVREKFRRRKN